MVKLERPGEHFTVAETAKFLDLTVATVQKQIQKGEIRSQMGAVNGSFRKLRRRDMQGT